MVIREISTIPRSKYRITEIRIISIGELSLLDPVKRFHGT